MSPEIPTLPSQEPAQHTPESIQECFILSRYIDEQLNLWRSASRHPMMHTQSFAMFVAKDCTPLDHEPIDYHSQTGFDGTMTIEEAHHRTEYELRRSVLSEWVQHEEIDTIPIHNEAIADHFEFIASFTTHPSVREEFRTATRSLTRLFILREQLALQLGKSEVFDVHDFIAVFDRIWDELA